jgi:hypothetical protein
MIKNFSLGILVYFVIAAFSMFFIAPVRDNTNVNNSIYMSFTGFSALAGILALKIIGAKGARGRALLTSVSATIAWFIGELISVIEVTRDGFVTFPSVSDLFFLIGYIMFLVYLVHEIRLSNITFHSLNKRIIAMSSLAALVAIGSFIFFASSLTYSGESSLWENITTIGYGVGDIFLIITSVFLIQLIWMYRGGKISSVWYFLLAGFILITIADYLYGIYFDLYEANSNPVTNIVNAVYIAGYGAIAIHYLKFCEIIQGIQLKALPKNK